MKCHAPGLVYETEKKATQKWPIEFFCSFYYSLQNGQLDGPVTDCSLDCCEGNLCNEIQGPTTKPQDQPINEAFELVASFGAILFVLALNMFA